MTMCRSCFPQGATIQKVMNTPNQVCKINLLIMLVISVGSRTVQLRWLLLAISKLFLVLAIFILFVSRYKKKEKKENNKHPPPLKKTPTKPTTFEIVNKKGERENVW